jgi:hypothetical protein
MQDFSLPPPPQGPSSTQDSSTMHYTLVNIQGSKPADPVFYSVHPPTLRTLTNPSRKVESQSVFLETTGDRPSLIQLCKKTKQKETKKERPLACAARA